MCFWAVALSWLTLLSSSLQYHDQLTINNTYTTHYYHAYKLDSLMLYNAEYNNAQAWASYIASNIAIAIQYNSLHAQE